MRTALLALLAASGCQGGPDTSASTDGVTSPTGESGEGSGGGARWDTASAWENPDGSEGEDTVTDELPAHSLQLREALRWPGLALAEPQPGDLLTGSLLVEGTWDGSHPRCAARFAATGTVAEASCTGCTLALEVALALEVEGAEALEADDDSNDSTDDTDATEGDTGSDSGAPTSDTGSSEVPEPPELGGLAACPWPEQPVDGASFTLAWQPDQGLAARNLGGTGLWIDWYRAALVLPEETEPSEGGGDTGGAPEATEADLLLTWSQTFAAVPLDDDEEDD